MRVRSELDGREWTLDGYLEWVEDGRLPRDSRAKLEDISPIRAQLSPAPGQSAWAQVLVHAPGDYEGGEVWWEPVALLDDGKGVDADRDPRPKASAKALSIAALPTDEQRAAALDECLSEDGLLGSGADVRNLLAWARSPAVYCTGRREEDAELEEAESVAVRAWPSKGGG